MLFLGFNPFSFTSSCVSLQARGLFFYSFSVSLIMTTKLSSTLLKHVIKLSNSRGQVVHLLGTAHVSERSCAEVKELIHIIKPAAVFVELCEQRRSILEPGYIKDANNLSFKERIMAGDNPFQVMYLLLMKMYDLKPGKEFVAASETAKELDIPLILGDRPVKITVDRLWMGLTMWQKAKLCWYFIPKPTIFEDPAPISSFEENDVNRLVDNRDLITKEMFRLGKKLPWVVESLINERDLFMVLELEILLKEMEKGDVVAVVGAGHMDGMQRVWTARQTPPLPTEEETQKEYEHIILFPGMEGVNYTKRDLQDYAKSVTEGK